MTEPIWSPNRRQFLKETVLGGIGLSLFGVSQNRIEAAESASPTTATGSRTSVALSPNSLTWLDGAPPETPVGITWGVPWQQGNLGKETQLTLSDSDGKAIPAQSWPLAYWPDGSLKWTGIAIAANAQMSGPFKIGPGSAVSPQTPVKVVEKGDEFEISTGPLVCIVCKKGEYLIRSLKLGEAEVGKNGRLVLIREDRKELAAHGITKQENYRSRVSEVTVEQSGPVRAVVCVRGKHASEENDREWLPFVVRMYFTSGLNCIRMVHSFVFDGDAQTDFIKGLGISFTVPFREERQNRHVRFATDLDGVWAEPVLMCPGYRAVLVKGALEMNRLQMQGKRVVNLEDLSPKTKSQIESVAVWDSFKLSQSTPDSFSIDKRTGPDSSWLHVLNGQRARGLAFVGDVSGGLALGSKYFWEKYPSALEVTGASATAGELKLWFWSPDVPAMDLRHYDIIGHDGVISYEDYQEGFSTPNGVANTNELMLWVLSEVPDNATVDCLAKTTNDSPLIVCQPSYYHDTRTLGTWSLPDSSTEDNAAIEEQLDRAWKFFAGEVDRRRWYGFWDFGDFMRTYSDMQHGWMYDIGGHAWNNTELMPNAWLWFTFLRSGRADVFRLAEAMTRNTSEVDVYHSGKFKELGSRHNVNHWGCGAKEARISEAWLKRFYYYLTADERTGDLMREVLTVDETIAQIQPLRKELVRKDAPIIVRIGPDWLAMASNWMTEWERTGNTLYRDYVLTGMKCIGGMPEAFTTRLAFRYDLKTKELFDIGEPNLKAGEFLDLFGGDQIITELIRLIDCPTFAAAWNLLCDKWGKNPSWKGYSKMRISAYAGLQDNDQSLIQAAEKLMIDSLKMNGHDRFPANPNLIKGPEVAEPVEEVSPLDTPGVSQWAINVLTTKDLIDQFKGKKSNPA